MAGVEHPTSYLDGLRRRARRWANDNFDLFEEPLPQPPPEPARETPDDGLICRICFAGREEEASLGRLFSPCLCRGTMSKVHTQCLEDWRRQSQGQKSFFQCDQCGFRYRIGRTRIAGLISSPPALIALTTVLLLLLAFVAGNASFFLLSATDMLPSSPFLYDTLWYLGFASPWQASNPLYWGDVVHGGLEESLDVFTAPSWMTGGPLGWVIGRMSLGAAVLGLLSFIQLAASFAMLGHIHTLRLFSRRRGQGRDGRPGERSDMFALIVIGIVLFGLARAFLGLYRLVRRNAKYVLLRLGERVLEVHA